jgi:hypothetical protein
MCSCTMWCPTGRSWERAALTAPNTQAAQYWSCTTVLHPACCFQLSSPLLPGCLLQGASREGGAKPVLAHADDAHPSYSSGMGCAWVGSKHQQPPAGAMCIDQAGHVMRCSSIVLNCHVRAVQMPNAQLDSWVCFLNLADTCQRSWNTWC